MRTHLRFCCSPADAKCRTNYQPRPTTPPEKKAPEGAFYLQRSKPGPMPRRTENNKMADLRGVIKKGHPRLLRSGECFASDRVGHARVRARTERPGRSSILTSRRRSAVAERIGPDAARKRKRRKAVLVRESVGRSGRSEKFRAGAGKRRHATRRLAIRG